MDNPNIIQIPIEFLSDFKRDPITAWQSFGDRPRDSESPYFENRKAVHAMVDMDRPNPIGDDLQIDPGFRCVDEFYRFMHIDLGQKRDACGISMCHVSDWAHSTIIRRDGVGRVEQEEVLSPVFTFDFICQIKPSQFDEEEVIFSDVRKLIYKIDELGFPIYLITLDRFQSVDTIQTLKRHGFVCSNLSLDRTTTYPVVDLDKKDRFRKESVPPGKFSALSAWLCGKIAINTGRVHVPFYRPVSENLSEHGDPMDYITLIEREAFGATYDSKAMKVKEPPRGSIDLLESVVGSIFIANANVTTQQQVESGSERLRRETQAVQAAETIHDYEDTVEDLPEFFDGDPLFDREEELF